MNTRIASSRASLLFLPPRTTVITKPTSCHRLLSSAATKKRDPYEVLGATKSETTDEIKRKYFALAKKFHPDQNKDNPQAASKFQEIADAWETLSDPEKRKTYDQFGFVPGDHGHAGGGDNPFAGGPGNAQAQAVFERVMRDLFSGGGGGGGPGFNPFGGFDNGFSDMPNNGSASRVTRGQDVIARADITFEDAVKGTKTDVKYAANVKCTTCSGSGAKGGKADMKKCAACKGKGVITQVVGGYLHVQQTCSSCGGMGQELKNPCPDCHGNGCVPGTKTTAVNIPAGVDTGMSLRMSGKGDAGNLGGPSGDLIVEIRVKSNPLFERDGADVRTTVQLSLVDAILGTSKPVRTIDDTEISLKVPQGTNHGEIVKIKNKGFTQVQSTQAGRTKTRGDHYVRFMVEMPKNLTDEQLKLLKEFDKIEKEKKGIKSDETDSDGGGGGGGAKTILGKIKEAVLG